MSKGRDIAAESLVNVFELARLGRQSGLLSVEHAQGGHIEEGEIYFQEGQPVNARVGQMEGQDALAWLLRWRQVYFTFLTDVPYPPANVSAPHAGSVYGSVSLPLAPPSPASYPQFGGNVSTGLLTEHELSYASSSSGTNLYPSGLVSLVPQKLGNGQDVLSLPLTRPQRCIYFLVNGQRTISDLSRTAGKSIEEVERILSELQEQGLVSV